MNKKKKIVPKVEPKKKEHPKILVKNKENKKLAKIREPQSWSRYIYRVFRTTHVDACSDIQLTLSMRTMGILNNFINDIFEKIAKEAADLVKKSGRKTMIGRDVATAVKLLLSGELYTHAHAEGSRAILALKTSKEE